MPYEHQLSTGERRELLRIARSTLREHVRSGRIPPGKPHRESMLAPGAVVATLRAGGQLRGRMSTPDEHTPLYRAIQNSVTGAASRDPRFEPVSEGELDDISVEIAVLGPRSPARGPDDIEIGAHGLVVGLGGRRGELLPHVAVERELDAEGFLAHTCAQAGARADAWRKPDAVIEVFTAQIFGDSDLLTT